MYQGLLFKEFSEGEPEDEKEKKGKQKDKSTTIYKMLSVIGTKYSHCLKDYEQTVKN